LRILITGGGCREYIDGVRVVTNSSTGRTSACLADIFSSKGHEVTLITADNAIKAKDSSILNVNYQTGEELAAAIKAELTSKSYDAVIHAAAVSDFIPDTITVAGKTVKAGKDAPKLPSGGEMTVTFKASPKIADSLHSWAALGGNPAAKVICFKLLNLASEEEKSKAVTSLLGHSKADFVVYNDLSKITPQAHPFILINSQGKTVAQGKTNQDLAQAIEGVITMSNYETGHCIRLVP